jgi:hypothetical protein
MRKGPMIRDLEQIEYRQGMLKRPVRPGDLPVKVWRGAQISAEMRAAVEEEDLLNLGGVYGDERSGYPVQYDNLRLVLREDTIEITVFNRAITLFLSNDEKVRRIHRVLCKLDGRGKD